MPAKAPQSPAVVTEQLAALGARIRAQRKALRVSATALAEASGMSRVSVHRIEQGEPSVTMGAYLNVLAALGMTFSATVVADEAWQPVADDKAGWLPARVCLADFPALRQLAWQVQGTDELTPREALGIYERNWRHVDEAALLPHERNLIDALRLAFGGSAWPGSGDV
ncbi:MAG: XRE family transcriptional regulator [Betaproteobacteria bacterium HGW-Betaproteobacteria-5]|jgi:transcriptional regulator with XRE-family HTH domain|nr:MAG: XRE family transcriptional regulator [Betaproteobacteria bacterium HGW-Betaproteobacteria-5]PKO37428.1 MAG: XRE family transcriptional regulator [Betaproteobacteria bacterium HGW-Betaproteobacteria-6]